jgi:hypothetical protein
MNDNRKISERVTIVVAALIYVVCYIGLLYVYSLVR